MPDYSLKLFNTAINNILEAFKQTFTVFIRCSSLKYQLSTTSADEININGYWIMFLELFKLAQDLDDYKDIILLLFFNLDNQIILQFILL